MRDRQPTRAGQRRRSCSTALAVLGLAGCLAMVGCDEERKPIFSTTPDHKSDEQRQAILAEIAQLANGKQVAENADAAKLYDEARTKLINRGSAIEGQLLEAIAGNADWGVRLGAIEVLQATGTRHCVETLIAALDDPHPIVALYAKNTLVELCKHDEIPAAGKPPGSNGLPAVPQRDPKDLAYEKDVQLWSGWHKQHHDELRKAWQAWWSVNKDKVKID